MTTRTIQSSVTFGRSFLLAGLGETLPAGTYCVETEEELIDSLSFPAYRRISTLLRLPTERGPAHLSRAVTIDPGELDAALERDRASAGAPPAVGTARQ
jgi:hypothetical protein